jgi:hypothetical protein
MGHYPLTFYLILPRPSPRLLLIAGQIKYCYGHLVVVSYKLSNFELQRSRRVNFPFKVHIMNRLVNIDVQIVVVNQPRADSTKVAKPYAIEQRLKTLMGNRLTPHQGIHSSSRVDHSLSLNRAHKRVNIV